MWRWRLKGETYGIRRSRPVGIMRNSRYSVWWCAAEGGGAGDRVLGSPFFSFLFLNLAMDWIVVVVTSWVCGCWGSGAVMPCDRMLVSGGLWVLGWVGSDGLLGLMVEMGFLFLGNGGSLGCLEVGRYYSLI